MDREVIKIPFVFYKSVASEVDYESLGIEPPKEDTTERVVKDAWVHPDVITIIEPNIEGDGSYVNLGKEMAWLSTLEPEEIADLINGTITIKA